jgi:hypothetical protein
MFQLRNVSVALRHGPRVFSRCANVLTANGGAGLADFYHTSHALQIELDLQKKTLSGQFANHCLPA